MKCPALDDLSRFDCAIIVTDPSDYDCEGIVKESKPVVDMRNATGFFESPEIVLC